MPTWNDPGLGDHAEMSPARARDILFHAAGISRSLFDSYPAWMFAAEVFRLGPKGGENICVHAGIDPFRTMGEHRKEREAADTAAS